MHMANGHQMKMHLGGGTCAACSNVNHFAVYCFLKGHTPAIIFYPHLSCVCLSPPGIVDSTGFHGFLRNGNRAN